MNKKVIFSVTLLFISLLAVSAFSVWRINQAYKLERLLFTCSTHPDFCPDTFPLDDAQQDSSEIADTIHSYLKSESGFRDINWSNFDVSSYPPLLIYLETAFTFHERESGFSPLRCSLKSCQALENGLDAAILVGDKALIHQWDIDRTYIHLGPDGMVLSGIETQSIVAVPVSLPQTAKEVRQANNLEWQAKEKSLLETAHQEADNVLWSKVLQYDISCTIGGCIKIYTLLKG